MTFGFEGIKVIDVSQVVAVPMAARFLADFGADVIHVENREGGDYFRGAQGGMGRTTAVPSKVNYVWENLNRNKRSISLDLSQDGGQKILYKLASQSDVFLTNLRPFEKEKFKIEYNTLSKLNPRLIYGSLTGFGKKGADRNAPAYDHNAYWARSGIPHRLTALVSGFDSLGIPPPAYMPAFGDNLAAMILACGIMTALFVRERTGLGQEVDTSLFQSGVYQLSSDIAGTLITKRDCERRQSREDIPNPLATLYQTKDGRWLLFNLSRPARYWSRFCQAIERPDLEHDPRFESLEIRKENRVALMLLLDKVFLSKTLDQWKPRLDEGAFPWSLVQNLLEVVNDPQAKANDFFVTYDHPTYGPIELVANPIKLSRTVEKISRPAPEFGQHSEEVLLELGYSWQDIERFKEQKIIA